MKFSTQTIHGGYQPGNGEPSQLPIAQSTTFKYDSTADVAALFDLSKAGFFYTRLGNPTTDAVERKLAALEGGVGAMLTSSGMAATLITILTIAKCGEHVISTSSIYGGTFNLFAVTLKRMGIEVTFIDQNADDATINAAFRDNTRLVFAETLANPALDLLDISRIARIAHEHGLPLAIDNTFPTPYLCRPIEFGADIVVHSTTKYLDGHGVQVGGAIVDSGKFNWSNGKFPEFTTPDPSYHGLVYVDAFHEAAFIVKARAQMMRDLGCSQTAQGAFYLNLGIETLPLRMERHSRNALEVARYLERHPKVQSVKYPGLESSPDHALAQKYLREGMCSGVLSLILKGGREAGVAFIDHLKLVRLEVHVAEVASCTLHPASSTHRQLTDEQLEAAGAPAGLVRLSVGIEDVEDILADLEQALSFA